jgi:hypothetical protein
MYAKEVAKVSDLPSYEDVLELLSEKAREGYQNDYMFASPSLAERLMECWPVGAETPIRGCSRITVVSCTGGEAAGEGPRVVAERHAA